MFDIDYNKILMRWKKNIGKDSDIPRNNFIKAIIVCVLSYVVYLSFVDCTTASSTIVLVGVSGAGKSTLANNLLQKEAFEVCGDPAACTREHTSRTEYIVVERHHYLIPKKYLKLTVIDTIGFADARSNKTDEKTAKSLKEKLQDIKSKNVVYLINDGRIKSVDVQLMAAIKREFVDEKDKVLFAINRLGSSADNVAQLKGKLISEWDHVVESNSTIRPKFALMRGSIWGQDKSKFGYTYYYEDIKAIYNACM